MKLKKKILALVMTAVLALGLLSCGGKNESTLRAGVFLLLRPYPFIIFEIAPALCPGRKVYFMINFRSGKFKRIFSAVLIIILIVSMVIGLAVAMV